MNIGQKTKQVLHHKMVDNDKYSPHSAFKEKKTPF